VSFDPKPLTAFFDEVKDQLQIELKYLPEEPKFPIQLVKEEGISKNKCIEIFQFIKTQVDLRDNQIGKIHPAKTPGKFVIEITKEATEALADVYALSSFYPHEDDDDSDK
jgi:hypothetical protein